MKPLFTLLSLIIFMTPVSYAEEDLNCQTDPDGVDAMDPGECEGRDF